MTSVQHSRYALFHHPSQTINHGIEWRLTPRSKKYVAIVPPSVLPGPVTVLRAQKGKLDLQITPEQADALKLWFCNLGPDAMRPTACDTLKLCHNGPYSVIGTNMVATDSMPAVGSQVLVRVTARVNSIGPLYKSFVIVHDVLEADIVHPGEHARAKRARPNA
jgi:hypothetical protein